jgi:WD40 repeat protein
MTSAPAANNDGASAPFAPAAAQRLESTSATALVSGTLDQETLCDGATAGLAPGGAPQVPAHRLLRPIGEGSYGTIWLAVNAMGTYRAVKVVYRSQFRDERPYEREYDGIKRFEPLSRSHEGFVDILQAERNDAEGYFYYVMELADDMDQGQQIQPDNYRAKTLADERDKRRWLPLEECLQIAVSLASALEHLHKNKLVHRDIKAANIVFINGAPKLADIGLVSEIRSDSTFVGTPGFIPPEGPGAPSADIYSLGKVLYEISTGLSHRDFPALPQDASVPVENEPFREWHALLRKACEDNVSVRYYSATELQAHLGLIRAGKSVKRLLQIERYVHLGKQFGPLALALLLLIPLVLFEVVREKRRAAEDRQRQAGSFLAYGSRALADGEYLSALPWLVRALRFDQGDQAKELTDRVRIGSALQHSPRLVQIHFDTGIREYAEFGATDDQVLGRLGGEGLALWGLRRGDQLSPLLGTQKGEKSSFSPDFKRVVTYNSGTSAYLWELATGHQLASIPCGGWILSARFDPTGRRVVTVENEAAEPKVWDWQAGREIAKFPGHSNHLWSASFSPDGRKVVAATVGGQAVIWDAASGEHLLTFARHRYWVHEAVFSPDSQWIATASGDHTARVWEASTGREIVGPLLHNDHVKSAQFSPDGRSLLTACLDGTVRVWDLQSGHQAAPTLTHNARVAHAAFSPSGQRVLTVGVNGTVCLWELRTVAPAELGTNVAFSRDGLRQVRFTNQTVRVSRTLQDQEVASIPLPEGRLSALALDSSGATLLTVLSVADPSGTPRQAAICWDLLQGTSLLLRLAANAPLSHWVLSADGRRLAARDPTHVSVWDTRVPDAPRIIATPAAAHLALDDRGERLCIARGPVVDLWSLVSQPPHLLRTITNAMAVSHVEFAPNNNLLLTACCDDSLAPSSAQLWDPLSGRPATPPLRHRDGVLYATFSPNGAHILTCSEDFTAALWQTATGQRLPVPALSHRGQVVSAAFSQNGLWVLTVERGGTVRVWDAASGELVMPPLRHATAVDSAQFIANDSRLVTRRTDGTVQLWEIPKDLRPVEDLSLMASFLTGQRADQAADAELQAEEEWRRAWDHLQQQYPNDFGEVPP